MSISYIYTSKSKNILLIIHYVKLYNILIKKSNLYVYMLFLVYLSIEESTSGVPEYNRGAEKVGSTCKTKKLPRREPFALFIQLRLLPAPAVPTPGSGWRSRDAPLSRKISILYPPWPASSLTLKCCNRSHR